VSKSEQIDASWDVADPRDSLERCYEHYVRAVLEKAIDWYDGKWVGPRRWAKCIRWTGLCGAAAGFVIVIVSAVRPDGAGIPGIPASWGLAAAVLGAGIVSFDRILDMTSAWIRYLTAYLDAIRLRDRANLEWTRTVATWPEDGPTTVQVSDALDLIIDLNSKARDLVGEETRAWAHEFRHSRDELHQLLRGRATEGGHGARTGPRSSTGSLQGPA